MSDIARRALRVLTLGLAGALAAGCANQQELGREQLAQLLTWYPGQYDNRAQFEAQGSAKRREHIVLHIQRIYAPRIGRNVYFERELSADNPERMVGERIVSFDVADDGRIVQSQYRFTDPGRWRGAASNPDMFKALIDTDFEPLSGCELEWQRRDELFVGENDRKRCRATSSSTGETMLVEQRAELGVDELALGEISFDAAGRLVAGDPNDPFFRFQKMHAR
ncbi:MAG: chromophore lyase CpcT/CpeT [Steroidobacteraceae bacterium]